jgi:hypothetical protein
MKPHNVGAADAVLEALTLAACALNGLRDVPSSALQGAEQAQRDSEDRSRVTGSHLYGSCQLRIDRWGVFLGAEKNGRLSVR